MPAPINSYVGPGNSDLEQIKRAPTGTLAAEKKRLRKATQEFESFFLYQMLKEMRKTVPESAMSQGTPLSDGLGKETFTDLFDLEIARSIKVGGNSSISDMLYNSLEQLIDAKYEDGETIELSPLKPPEQTPIPFETGDAIKQLPEKEQFHPVRPSQQGEPIQISPPVSVTTDPIMGRYGRIIDEAAASNKLDSSLIAAVIKAESAGDHKAVSPAGAKGLMQLTDSTATDLGVVNVFDPQENIQAGSRYLRQMLDRFGDLKLALAAYNAGPGAVARYDGIPPYDETQGYVERVTGFMELNDTRKIGQMPKEVGVSRRQ